MAHSHLPQSILKRGRQVSDSRGTAIEISGDTIYPDKGVRITSPAVTKTAVPSPSSAFPAYLVDSVALTVQPGPSGISQSSNRLASHTTQVTSTTGPSQPVPKERLSDSSGTSLQPSVPNPPGENHWLRLTPSSYPSQVTATGPSAQDFEVSSCGPLVSEDTERPETQSRRPLKMQPHHRLLHRLMSSNSPDDPVPEPHRDVSTGVLVGSSLSLEDERNSSHSSSESDKSSFVRFPAGTPLAVSLTESGEMEASLGVD